MGVLPQQVSAGRKGHKEGPTCEQVQAALHGLPKQSRVGSAQVQQHSHVLLGLQKLNLCEVHQRGTLNDQELYVQKSVVVAHSLEGQVVFSALQ